MKTLVTVAALTFSSTFAFAADLAPNATPMQMTDSEMDQVVAGAGLGLNPNAYLGSNGKGAGAGLNLDPKEYLGSKGKGLQDGSCQ